MSLYMIIFYIWTADVEEFVIEPLEIHLILFCLLVLIELYCCV